VLQTIKFSIILDI